MIPDWDMQSASDGFKNAKLYHLYPVWPAAKGICAIIEYIKSLIKSLEKQRPEPYDKGVSMIERLSHLLLRDRSYFLKTESSRGGTLRRMSCTPKVISALRKFCSLSFVCFRVHFYCAGSSYLKKHVVTIFKENMGVVMY